MTANKLAKILLDANLPDNVVIMSDSGWECGPTDMHGIFYNATENYIVVTQGSKYELNEYIGWKVLYIKDLEIPCEVITGFDERGQVRIDENGIIHDISLTEEEYQKLLITRTIEEADKNIWNTFL